MSVLIWNVWGLGSPRAFTRLRNLLRSHSPEVVFLLETKLYGRKARFLYRKAGFFNGFHVDANGSSGGLVLMWKEEWEIEVWNYSKNHMDVKIVSPQGEQWRFSGIYGEPSQQDRCLYYGDLMVLQICHGCAQEISMRFFVFRKRKEDVSSHINKFAILATLWKIAI